MCLVCLLGTLYVTISVFSTCAKELEEELTGFRGPGGLSGQQEGKRLIIAAPMAECLLSDQLRGGKEVLGPDEFTVYPVLTVCPVALWS